MTDLTTPGQQFDKHPSGILYGVDDSGKIHFQSTPESSKLEAQFVSIAEKLECQVHLDPRVRIIFSLVMNDACISQKSHRAALAAFGSIYKSGESVKVDMKYEHGWRDSRRLSEQTLEILQTQTAPVVFTSYHMRVANQALCNVLNISDAEGAWNTFYAMAAAYWGSSLPKLLWAHCVHISPLQPLTKKAYVRRQTGMPLRHACSADEMQVAQERSTYFSVQVQTLNMTCIIDAIQLVVDQASENQSKQAFVQKVVNGLRGHIGQAMLHGRLQVLLILAAIDLIANGGVQGELAISSMVSYMQSTYLKLARALINKHLDALTGAGWLAVYEDVLQQSTGNKDQIRAALAAFHDFLEWLDVPQLPRGIGGHKERRPPKAEVVWDHECRRAIDWIELHADHKDRVAELSVLAILILGALMIRVEEVLNLRLCDIHFASGVCTVFVYPRISDGSMKSSGVRHPREVTDAMALRYLRKWFDQRSAEVGIDTNAYLFGHRREAGRRFEPGRVYQLIVLALKVATGEPTASTHCPRHRNSSLAIEQQLMPDTPTTEYSAIDQISSDAGQNVTTSLRETYVNIYEDALYAHVQRRRPYAGNPIDWNKLQWIPNATKGIELDDQEAWKAIKFPSYVESMALEDVIHCLVDLCDGMFSELAIAFRNNMTIDQVQMIADVACKGLDNFKKTDGKWPDPASDMLSRRLKLQQHKPMLFASLQDKYFPIRNWIDGNHQSEGARRLIERCLSDFRFAVKRWHFSGEELRDCASAIDLFQEAQLPVQRMLVTHSVNNSVLPDYIQQLGWTIDEPRKHRRGEPRIRFHICSVDADSPSSQDAARSMKGFYSLVIAASAFFQVKHPKGE